MSQFHPIVVSYAADTGQNLEGVFKHFQSALVHSCGIIDMGWGVLQHIGLTRAFIRDKVFDRGWDYDADTRALKKRFEEIVYYRLSNKPLEEYV